jgi:hypothetical protein
MQSASQQSVFLYNELDYLTDHWSDSEIAKRLGLSYALVRKERIQYGIQTFTQKTGMVRMKETGELRPRGSVRGVIRKDGLIEDYFKEIDSNEKAYWLGALMADGWSTLRNGKPKEIGLAVNPKDVDWIQSFQNSIKHSGAIETKTNKKSLSNCGFNTVATIRVTCQRFTHFAIQAGVVPNKSGKLKFPDIDDAYNSHFVRGLFDGDGWIGPKAFALICVSELFCNEVQNVIYRHTGRRLKATCPVSRLTGKPIYRLTGYRKDYQAIAWIYSDECLSMKRKYKKYLMFWS